MPGRPVRRRGSQAGPGPGVLLAAGLLASLLGCAHDEEGTSGPFTLSLPVTPDPLPVGRAQHSAIPLPGGEVLVTGGIESTPPGVTCLDDSWTYDPGTGAWSFAGTLSGA